MKLLQRQQPTLHRRVKTRISCVATGPARSSQPHTRVSTPPKGTVIPFKIPSSLKEVDNGQILGFGAELSVGHPGYYDEAYKHRRVDICRRASTHIVGQPIPHLDYFPEEVGVWTTVFDALEPLHKSHACSAYQNTFPLFNYSREAVPQLQDLSEILQETSGWVVRPTAGLLHPRDFLAGLAFKCFHSTQYMRHHSNPNYTPEPDVIHDALGHVPMLADPAFSELARHIGIASLGAQDKHIWELTKIYWYTVEFGVIQKGGVKAFGAGILSSFGEMQNMIDGKAELIPFDPFSKLPKINYSGGYQTEYFVLESFEDGAAKLREYCEEMQKKLPAEVRAAVEQVMVAER